MGEEAASSVVLVHLVGGGYVRGAEALQDVVDEMAAEGTRFVTLTDPGDEHPKVIPVDRVLYVEEVES